MGEARRRRLSLAVTPAERAAMARAMYAEACRRADRRSTYRFEGSRDAGRETPPVWLDRLDAALAALAEMRNAGDSHAR